MSSERPIAIFDSGVGGISVLKVMRSLMPGEDYIYYGDSLNAPYGIRTQQEIIALCDGIIEKMLGMQAKCIVIACNTATSAAAAWLREKYSHIPIIGMEPAVKPAALKGGRVLVMATPVTIEGEKLHRLVKRFESEAEYLFLPAPDIVRHVEAGETDGHVSDELREYISRLTGQAARMGKIDTVVLGCTHFPFVRETIKAAFPYEVQIVDGAEGTAVHTKNVLSGRGELSERKSGGSVLLLNSSSEGLKCEKLLFGE